jgi:thiamine-monophosphate kinase
MDEFSIIELFYNTDDLIPVPEPYRDDCALLYDTILITTDSMAEHTHFIREWSSPEDIAIKLFQMNLSDISASGGAAEWCLLNLGLTRHTDEEFVRRFALELRRQVKAAGCRLVGGDTFRSDSLHFTLTVGGRVRKRHMMRMGGCAGDSLYLTGTIGLALAGYEHLSGKAPIAGNPELLRRAVERHLRPAARADWSKTITAREAVHAAMDLSDGLYLDSERLSKANRLRLEIDLDAIPIDEGLRGFMQPERAVLSGEEFEVLFLAEPGIRFEFPCREIGHAVTGEGVAFFKKGRPVEITGTGFIHFE